VVPLSPWRRKKGVSLSIERVDEHLLGELDQQRTMQVLANLITNAIKFTRQGGSIRVRSWREADSLCFAIRDSGAGIAPDKLESIFERFWQAGQDDRRGLGLGLYISRCIVEAHGGRIWAESKLGEGSTLRFTLRAPRIDRAVLAASIDALTPAYDV
jgi:signal transduction histidine kinase